MGNNSPLVKTSSRQSIFQMDMWLFKEEKSIWMRYHVTAGPFFLIFILWFLYNFWQKKKKERCFPGYKLQIQITWLFQEVNLSLYL